MELTVAVPELSKALSRVQGIVEKKTTMPSLANVLLEVSGEDRFTVSATDLEIALRGQYKAKVKGSGSICLAAKALYDIVRSLPEKEVVLKKSSSERVDITCGKVKYRVVCMSVDDFPSLPAFEEVDFFAIDGKVVKEMVDKTLYATSTDETRYNLTGVYCEAVQGSPGLRMVATDGHRLSLIERPTESAPLLKEGIIIPKKGLSELRKLLDDGDEPGRLGFVENSAVFEKSDLVLSMRLIDGRFPDYQQVLPSSSSRRFRVRRQAFLSALKRTSLLCPDRGQGVRLELEDSTLSLAANNPDLGEAREELEVVYDGEPLKIGFNFRYLMDAFAAVSEEDVEMELTDELSPGVLKGLGSEGYQAVVMPMRI